jgi:hypothetical protein
MSAYRCAVVDLTLRVNALVIGAELRVVIAALLTLVRMALERQIAHSRPLPAPAAVLSLLDDISDLLSDLDDDADVTPTPES